MTVTISLRGLTAGTARLASVPGGTEAAFALRGFAPAAAFFVESGSLRTYGCAVENGRCFVALKNICAAAVFDGAARLISFGAVGACGAELKRKLDELRIMAAELLAKRAAESDPASSAAPPDAGDNAIGENSVPQNSAPGASQPHASPQIGEKTKAPSASSEAARAILGKARELFGALEGGSVSAGQGAAEADGYEAVRNPFPRTYPNSEWKRRRGEDLLYGRARTSRGILRLTAVPMEGGGRRRGNARYVIDVYGKGYLVKETRDN